MKNAIAIIAGALIISATVSVVQGQGLFNRSSECATPNVAATTDANQYANRRVFWVCGKDIYRFIPEDKLVYIYDMEEKTYRKMEFMFVN